MKGQIKSIAPKIVNGAHETFKGYQDKEFFVFLVTVDIDGTLQMGDANSTLKEPKWDLNKDCEITQETNDKATNGNKFKFKFGDRPAYQGGAGKGGGGKSPEDRSEIISQNAFGTAIKYLQVLEPDERKAIIEKYGPDGAFEKFATSISDKIMENAKRIKETYMS